MKCITQFIEAIVFFFNGMYLCLRVIVLACNVYCCKKNDNE